MKPLPIGIQTLSKIVDNGYLYVDKTQHIHRLITEGNVYFLARPRRFGKSLLISTLNEIFRGNKELFKGLWIYGSDYEWKQFPVIRLDFSKQKAEDREQLKHFINVQTDDIARDYGVELSRQEYYLRFEELIRKLGRTEKVVILIDEYDKPIIDNLETPVFAAEMREILKGFYTIIKASDEYIRFVLLTGVSKFAKTGVFSGLNNLNDISMDRVFSCMLGITEEELAVNFKEHVAGFADRLNVPEQELLGQIRHWYNGYCFSEECERVYNPFSTLQMFGKQKFSNYWFESGTPTFLIKLIKRGNFDITRLKDLEVGESAFSSYEIEDLNPLTILYQAGYLTITAYDRKDMLYTLNYPNYEVSHSFTEILLETYSGARSDISASYLIRLIKALRAKDIELFFETLGFFFAKIEYDIRIENEKYYQTVFFLIFSLIGLRIKTEVRTSRGRIDAVIDDSEVFIFEFKLGEKATKEEALEQIKSRGYAKPYLDCGKAVNLVGVVFRSRDEFDWIMEKS